MPHDPVRVDLALALVLLAALGPGCASPARSSAPASLSPRSTPGAPRPATATRMGVHGMVLFGDGPLFLSHVPMFHAPHDVQLVLEVRLDAAAGLPPGFSDQLYTIEPEPFALDAVRDGSRTRFTATVYRGNFEQGGTPIARAVGFAVTRIVLDQPLDAAAAALAAGVPAAYLALGSRRSGALVHVLGGPPGVDQIVAARFDDAGPTDAELAHGVRVFRAPGEAAIAPRLGLGRAALVGAGGAVVGATVSRELSCLVGPDFTAPCAP